MEVIPSNPSIMGILYEKDRYNVNPKYQRQEVWNIEKKQMLIDSILRGYDIPKLYIRQIESDESNFDFEVVDGKQRLASIWGFEDDEFSLNEKCEDIPLFKGMTGKKYSDFSVKQRRRFTDKKLNVGEIINTTDVEIRDFFTRLQFGDQLNPAERRNAIVSDMRDFISDIVENHSIFDKVKAKNKRYAYDDWLSICVKLELNGNPCDVKASDLMEMYKNYSDFDVNGLKARKVKSVLNFMNRMFPDNVESPFLNIKWGFVDVYYLVSCLKDKYNIGRKYTWVYDFYKDFELRRREVNNLGIETQLIQENSSYDDKLLYEYIQKFRVGNNKNAIETRSNVYLTLFKMKNTNIENKDNRRYFTEDERLIIWHRDNKICQICHQEVLTLNEMDADHIKKHSEGGKTTIDNGRCTHAICNRSRTD